MNPIRTLALVTLAAFGAFSASVVWEHGYLGLFQLALANSATTQVTIDLTIALAFVLVWMWRDARDRGVSPLPYVALTLGLGSIGPLVYLAVHGDGARR